MGSSDSRSRSKDSGHTHYKADHKHHQKHHRKHHKKHHHKHGDEHHKRHHSSSGSEGSWESGSKSSESKSRSSRSEGEEYGAPPAPAERKSRRGREKDRRSSRSRSKSRSRSRSRRRSCSGRRRSSRSRSKSRSRSRSRSMSPRSRSSGRKRRSKSRSRSSGRGRSGSRSGRSPERRREDDDGGDDGRGGDSQAIKGAASPSTGATAQEQEKEEEQQPTTAKAEAGENPSRGEDSGSHRAAADSNAAGDRDDAIKDEDEAEAEADDEVDSGEDDGSRRGEEEGEEDGTGPGRKKSPRITVTPSATTAKVHGDDDNGPPVMFEEAKDMLEGSILMYPFAALRKIAREEGMQCESDMCLLAVEELKKDIIETPISAKDIHDIIFDILLNKQRFKDGRGGFVNFDMLAKSELLGYETSDDAQKDLVALNNVAKRDAFLHYFVDDYEKKELVYAIARDDNHKRITVCFRGTIGSLNPMNVIMRRNPTRDWNINLDTKAVKLKTPELIKKLNRNCPRYITVHKGFHDYLLLGVSKGKKSKYDEIVIELRKLITDPKYQNYNIYVSGHSLGGALATLMAFKLANESDLPKPISCFSYASPFVGAQTFRDAFQALEEACMIRHLRVSNRNDLIPMMPPLLLPNWTSWAPSLFKHAGMHLTLMPYKKEGKFDYDNDRFSDVNMKPKLSYPIPDCGRVDKINRWINNSVFANASFDPLKAHSCTDYYERLVASMPFFIHDPRHPGLADDRFKYLDRLYKDLAMFHPTNTLPQKSRLSPALILCAVYSGLQLGGEMSGFSTLELIAKFLAHLDATVSSWFCFSLPDILSANAVALDFHFNFQAKGFALITIMGVILLCLRNGPTSLLPYLFLRQSLLKKYSRLKPKEYSPKTHYEHLQDIYKDKIPTPSLIERIIPANLRSSSYVITGICGVSMLVFLLFVIYPVYVLLCLLWWMLSLRPLSEGLRAVNPGQKWPIKAVVVVGGHWRLFCIFNKQKTVLRAALFWLPYVLEFAFFVEFFSVSSQTYCEILVEEFGDQFPLNKGIGFSTHAEVQKRIENPETTKGQFYLAWNNSHEQFMFSSRTTLFYPQNNGQRFIVTEGRRIAREYLKDTARKLNDLQTREYMKAMLPNPNDDGSMHDVVHIKRSFVSVLFHLLTGGELTRKELTVVDRLDGNVFPFLPSWINFLEFGGRKKREGMDDLKHFRNALLRYPDAEPLQNALKLANSLGWEHGETVRFLTYTFCIAGASVPPRLPALVLERLYKNPSQFVELYHTNPIKFIKEEARLANHVPILTSVNNDLFMEVEIGAQTRHIPLGTPLHCCMPLANRDPKVFGAKANTFDAERPANELCQMLLWNGTEEKICKGNPDLATSEDNPPRRCPGHDISLLITKFVVDLYMPPDDAHKPTCGIRTIKSNEGVNTTSERKLSSHRRHCFPEELSEVISNDRFKDIWERELSPFIKAILEAGRKSITEWNDNYPLAADALYPGDAEQKPLGMLRTATGDTAITYDEDDPPKPTFLVMKMALTQGAPVEDASGEWKSREEAIGWRIKYFGSSFPPVKVNYEEFCSEKQQLEAFAFAGFPCLRTKRINAYDEGHMVSKLRRPAQAEFINESLDLGDCKVRPGYQRYGAAAFFDANCKILGIYTHFNEKFVPLPHETSEREHRREWIHAMWVWKTSALALGTIVDHLGKTHLIESNALVSASRKHLPLTHPLRALLKIFTYRTASINATAYETLTVRKGLVERIWALEGDTIQGILRRVRRNYKFVLLCDNIDKSMKDLGDDLFPANKDAKEFWDITRDFVKQILTVIYKEGPLRMEDDEALQCFLQELNGRLRLDESDFEVTNFDGVVDVLASLICTVTAYHEHVGQVSDYFGDPTFAGTTLREGKEIDTIQTHCMLASLVAATGLRMPRLLDNWEHVLQHDVYSTETVALLRHFHRRLVVLSQEIEKRNEEAITHNHSGKESNGLGGAPRRRFVLPSFNPMKMSSSVSV